MLIYEAEVTMNYQIREIYYVLFENLCPTLVAETFIHGHRKHWEVIDTSRKAFNVKEYCKNKYRHGGLSIRIRKGGSK